MSMTQFKVGDKVVAKAGKEKGIGAEFAVEAGRVYTVESVRPGGSLELMEKGERHDATGRKYAHDSRRFDLYVAPNVGDRFEVVTEGDAPYSTYHHCYKPGDIVELVDLRQEKAVHDFRIIQTVDGRAAAGMQYLRVADVKPYVEPKPCVEPKSSFKVGDRVVFNQDYDGIAAGAAGTVSCVEFSFGQFLLTVSLDDGGDKYAYSHRLDPEPETKREFAILTQYGIGGSRFDTEDDAVESMGQIPGTTFEVVEIVRVAKYTVEAVRHREAA